MPENDPMRNVVVPDFADDDRIDLDDSRIPEHHGVQPLAIRKMAVLFLTTFGLYFFYWHFRTLKAIREHTGEPRRPLGRTLLLFIPVVNLFAFRRMLEQDYERMRERVGGQRFIRNSWVTVLEWAVLYSPIALLALTPRFPYWALALLAFIPIRPLQMAMNIYLYRLPLRMHDEKAFTLGEKVVIAIGSLATFFVFATQLAAFFERYFNFNSGVSF
jgi:hypothetical protein